MTAELARQGTRCRIVDRLAQPLPYCRAIGVMPRMLEVWDDMGIAREMIDAGVWLDGLKSIALGFILRQTKLGIRQIAEFEAEILCRMRVDAVEMARQPPLRWLARTVVGGCESARASQADSQAGRCDAVSPLGSRTSGHQRADIWLTREVLNTLS
jgi:hypothetical protein